jgi:peptide deformylase
MKRKLMFYLLFLTTIITFSQCKKDDTPQDNPTVNNLAFTDAEKAIVFNNSRDTALRVLNYFVYADSLILRKQSRNVDFSDTATLFYLTHRMFQSVVKEGGVGIAAPQVGINRNIIWVWRNDKPSHPWELYFNPRITAYSDTIKQRSDGCLSIPGVTGQSWRAIWVNVEYDLSDGTHKAEHISQAYTAQIFQHEIDHLNGIVWLDRRIQ